MKHDRSLDVLQPISKALNAPAFTQDKTYLAVIGGSLKAIGEARAYHEWAKQQPFNPAMQRYALKATSLLNADVLKTLGKSGSLVDEES